MVHAVGLQGGVDHAAGIQAGGIQAGVQSGGGQQAGLRHTGVAQGSRFQRTGVVLVVITINKFWR